MSSTPRLDAMGIVVSDLRASLRFYRMLGLELPEDPGDEQHVEATTPGGLRVMFDTIAVVRSFMPEWEPASGGHRMGLAFHCGDAAGVDATYARLTAAGYPGAKAPWDAFWGQRYAQVSDPDGNPVDLFAPLG
jgi:catechol 2,3-dioxygenase-like lactoylglutathione lyase family enzyme